MCVCVKVSALHVCKNAFAITDISLLFGWVRLVCVVFAAVKSEERESLNVGIYVVVVVVAVGIKLLIFDKDPHLMPFALLFSFSLLRTREVE